MWAHLCILVSAATETLSLHVIKEVLKGMIDDSSSQFIESTNKVNTYR